MYRNYNELKQNEILEKDYRISVLKRSDKILVAAPHGGRIEPSTSEIARSIASSDYSLYLFEGIKEKNNNSLHIKSTEFDEPLFLSLLKESEFVITIHGLKKSGVKILVGGLFDGMKDKIVENLSVAGFDAVLDNSPEHSGISPENICNKGGRGVQLEIMRELRDRLSGNSDLLAKFSLAVRKSLKEVLYEGSDSESS